MVDWFHHVKMKLPFLILPLAFFNLPAINKRTYHLLHYLFSVLLFLAAIPPLVNYLIHFNEFQEAIGQGKSIHLPVQHIKFSLFYAFGIISMIILYRNDFVYKWHFERKIQLLLIGLSVIVLHFLAVRTGIVVFYFTLFFLATIEGIIRRKWNSLVIVMIMLFIVPTISYYAIPSFYQKVNYMMWDYDKYLLKEGKGYSDSERLESITVGIEILKENLVFGTGIGDLKDECTKKYTLLLGPEKHVLYPHNQYLFIASGLGLLGLLAFFIFMLAPYLYFLKSMHPLFLSLGLVTFSAFFIDNLLERSVGVGFYAFFLSLGLSYLVDRKENILSD